MQSIEFLLSKAPLVKSWITDLLVEHEGQGKPVERYNFHNLKLYFEQRILSTAQVIIVNKIPQVPLSALGLNQFTEFENGNYAGVTYYNVYFLAVGHEHSESLHFHELIHVLQWERLGVDKFIKLYGLFLLQFNYRGNPLEEMAYKYQSLFERGSCPLDLCDRVRTETDQLYAAVSSQYPL